MKDYEFLDAVGGIDKRFIEKAESRTAKRPVWKYAMPVAACLVLLVGVYFAYPKLSPVQAPVPNPNGTIERTDEPETYPEHPILHPGDDGYIDIAPEPMPIEPGGTVNGFDGQTEILNGKPMISGYGENSGSVDMAVNNGHVYFTESLTSAMEEYSDIANYRVLVTLFQDGVQIWSGSETATQEAQRLIDMGYIVAMETVKHEEDHGEYASVTTDYFFTLHATYEQLKDFSPGGNLGYSFMLYDEFFGESPTNGTEVYNGFSPATN